MGQVYHSQGKYRSAEKQYLSGLNILQLPANSKISNPIDIAKFYGSLGRIFSFHGDYEKALDYEISAIEVFKGATENNVKHELLATSYMNIGITYKNLGLFDRSLEFYKASFETLFQVCEGDSSHSKLADLYINIGNVYSEQGKYLEAINSFKKVVNIYKRKSISNHSEKRSGLLNIGNVYKKMKKYHKAITYFQMALDSLNTEIKNQDPSHPTVAYYKGHLFEAYGLAKKFSFGEPLIQETLDILNYTEIDSLQSVSHMTYFVLTLHAKGNFYLNWYLESLDQSKLEIAYKTFSDALLVLDYQRTLRQDIEDKLNFTKTHFGIFEGAIRSAFIITSIKSRQHRLSKCGV